MINNQLKKNELYPLVVNHRIPEPDSIMIHKTRKIFSIVLALLLNLNLVSAMTAPQTGCPPRVCKGMASPMMHADATSMNLDAFSDNCCCGKSQDQCCNVGNQDPLELRDIQAYTASTTRVNSGNPLEMAAVDNQILTSDRNFKLPHSNLDAHHNDRSSPIYLLTLSLLI